MNCSVAPVEGFLTISSALEDVDLFRQHVLLLKTESKTVINLFIFQIEIIIQVSLNYKVTGLG